MVHIAVPFYHRLQPAFPGNKEGVYRLALLDPMHLEMGCFCVVGGGECVFRIMLVSFHREFTHRSLFISPYSDERRQILWHLSLCLSTSMDVPSALRFSGRCVVEL